MFNNKMIGTVDGQEAIISFSGPFEFLSNFYKAPAFFEGRMYPTAEHAFVSAKTKNDRIRSVICKMPTPGEAKRFGRTLELRDDWEKIKYSIMETVVDSKFNSQHSLLERLVGTLPYYLLEGNKWGDKVWGAEWDADKEEWRGANWLGKILMNVRGRAWRLKGEGQDE